MIKKKLLCFSLILTLASCLVACGDKEEKKPAETTTESTQESTTPEFETTTEEETTSAEEETSTEEETTSAEEETTTEEVTTEIPTTEAPTQKPTEPPTQKPTEAPTQKPTEAPTQKPTEAPTTEAPTTSPALTERQQECASALKLFYYDEYMINRGSAYRSLTTGNYEGGTAFTKEELEYVSNYLGLDWVEKGYEIYCLFADLEEWRGRDEEIKAIQNDYTSYTYEEAAYIIDKYIANHMN